MFQNIGELFKHLRQQNRLTRKEVFDKTEIKVNTLTNIENNLIKDYSMQKIIRLAVLYDLDLNTLKKYD